MKKSLNLFALLLFAATGSLHCGSAVNGTTVDPVKRQLCRQLMELTGESNLAAQIINAAVNSYQKNGAIKVPKGFWESFRSRANAGSGKLIEAIIPIWEKYYSTEDLRDLVRFYSSPLGKKLISEQPKIAMECMAVGRTWGEEMGREAAEDLKKNK